MKGLRLARPLGWVTSLDAFNEKRKENRVTIFQSLYDICKFVNQVLHLVLQFYH